MRHPKLLAFDMDGVLIDVSGSYRETVRKTATVFFSGSKGFEKLPDPLFPLTDLSELKETGGLNNDWDLTALALHLLFAEVRTPLLSVNPAEQPEWAEMMPVCDVSPLAEFLNGSSRPLTDLLRRHGRRYDPFVASCFRGDVLTGNIIKRIFQEIYLGRPLFKAQYGEAPRFHGGDGLIHRESLLIKPSQLADLSRRHRLAMATGRPRVEADFPLDRFGIRKYFQLAITLDDCLAEEERLLAAGGRIANLKKPDPYMLDLIPRLLGQNFSACFYLGDMPDDMQAARSSRTGYRGIGVTYSSSEPEALRVKLLQAGADFILAEPSALPAIVD